VIKRWLKRWSLWIAIVACAIFFGGRGQIEAEKLSHTVKDVATLTRENRQLVTSLQAAIVESCEQIGNERAQAAREQLHEEIMEAENPDPEVIAAFNLPPEKIDELIAENVAKLKGRLDHIKLVNCAAQYHISPGSGSRRRDQNADSSTP
jgi:hypothetical protein